MSPTNASKFELNYNVMVRDQFRRIWWESFGRDAANRELKQRRWQWERLLKRWISALSNFLNFVASIGPFRFCKWNQFPLELIFKDFIQVQKEKIRHSMFKSSIKRRLIRFHFDVVQWTSKNVLKGWRMCKAVVLLKKPIVFSRCCFRLRRRRCLLIRSLISLITDNNFTWFRHLSYIH